MPRAGAVGVCILICTAEVAFRLVACGGMFHLIPKHIFPWDVLGSRRILQISRKCVFPVAVGKLLVFRYISTEVRALSEMARRSYRTCIASRLSAFQRPK